MAVDEQFLYVGCKGTIKKYNLKKMNLISQITVNKTKKNAIYGMLNFTIFDEYVFVCDFYDLHIILKKDLQLLYTVRLGENVSSDIFGMIDFSSPNAYISIRNGRIDVLNVHTKKVARYEISDSTSWSNYVHENRIYYSTTKGELIEIKKDTMRVKRKVQLTKKMNIYSVVPYKNMLYTTSQKDIKAVDVNTFEIIRIEPEVLQTTEAKIIGIYGKTLVVVELKNIALFDVETLQLRERFQFPTGFRYMRYAVLSGNKIYGSDEHGIYCFSLKNDVP